ncbi:MAG: pirin-like C-terminal cupin domain-containing protein [bacterium]
MPIQRHLGRIVTTPAPGPGFMGDGHTAVLVVDPKDFALQDPFIFLADDRIDLSPGATAGGEHPHAGFETVTFVLEGDLQDHVEGSLGAGDVQWMTAGSGVIHNEDVVPQGKTRILQLWLSLPHADRWSAPRFETVSHGSAPVRCEPGVEVRVYSGNSGDAHATTKNYVPVTLADVSLQAGASVDQDLPASYNGFVYVLEGSVRVGDDVTPLMHGQVGWLDRTTGSTSTTLRLTAEGIGARVMLYAGEPTNVPIVMHGPFVGETRADLMRVSSEYMAGHFPRMSELVVNGER